MITGALNPAKRPEVREKIRLSKLGNTCGRSGKGIKHSPMSLETKQKISIALKGGKLSNEHRLNCSLAKMGHSFTDEGRKNLSLGQIRRFSDPIERRRIGTSNTAYWHSLSEGEQKSKVQPLLESTKDWANKPGADARRKAISIGNRRAWSLMTSKKRRQIAYKALETSIVRGTRHRPKARPNKAERFLKQVLDAYYPGEWKYTGNGEVWLGIYNPDFLNINGRKAVIELFGDYWHSKDSAEDKVDYYNGYGFQCLIVWESELKEEDIVQRLAKFQEGLLLCTKLDKPRIPCNNKISS